MSESLEQRAREAAEAFTDAMFHAFGLGEHGVKGDRLVIWDDARGRELAGWAPGPFRDRAEEFAAAFARSECGRLLEEAASGFDAESERLLSLATLLRGGASSTTQERCVSARIQGVAVGDCADQLRSLASGPPTDTETEERSDD